MNLLTDLFNYLRIQQKTGRTSVRKHTLVRLDNFEVDPVLFVADGDR